ncbi:DKNYY domain-containing protein [Chryseobacterium herbae]|uniref:DKNYY domain-containing protein n=1 Tax=Chryseobacterium herbae TaxID=2976476 RepID=A0ABT2IS16_9FLAO|nr:DKNYY domain-containing protein [Chryseobacterium sp. pc1-10]MCT2561614.1 DKNYY domain-containing protein [Chryseobacterium sp. pc1-10]
MNKNTFILLLLPAVFCFGQNKTVTAEVSVVEPEISNSLKVPVTQCKYVMEPVYLRNENNVIYHDCNTRKYLPIKGKDLTIPKNNSEGFFALDKEGVYYKGDYIKIDTAGFKIVGQIGNHQEALWKVKGKVYKNFTQIQVSDPDTFMPAYCGNGDYYKDKNFIYYRDKKMPDADVKTAFEACREYFYDKNYLYFNGKIARVNNEVLFSVNEALAKTKTKVYSRDMMPHPEMDAKTIRPLSRRFSVDAKNVYYNLEKLPIKGDFKNLKAWGQVNSSYLSDGQSIWTADGKQDTDLDAKTFGMLPHSDFFYDKKGVYKKIYSEKLKKAVNEKFPFDYTDNVSEQNLFITDNSWYIVYKNQAYDPWNNIIYKNLTDEQLATARQNTLNLSKEIENRKIEKQFSQNLYLADGKIYCHGEETDADAGSFTSVGANWNFYKDSKHVYRYIGYGENSKLTTIKGIDPQTVETFGNFLKDKDYIYSGNYKMIDNKNAQLLGVFTGYRPGCGLDKNPSSSYYLFRNDSGFWLVMISDKVVIRSLGMELPGGWHDGIKEFELKPAVY